MNSFARFLFAATMTFFLVAGTAFAQLPSKSGQQWAPYVEWSVSTGDYSGNPFDVVATVTFTHAQSGETRTTGMFYIGSDQWAFRFAGTRSGRWTFTTQSGVSGLGGLSGQVDIEADPQGRGFVSSIGRNWVWSATGEAFLPQYVMYGGPHVYHNDTATIDADIQTFMVDHGFTGFHVPVFCRWFDINEERCSNISGDPNPDLRTFEALEALITRVYQAGGVVHLWIWGDEDRRQTPLAWGINGHEDQRLQRYIAARLGPIPGWTAGYGFDLHEWAPGREVRAWRAYMHEHMGWAHLLGGRASGPQSGTNHDGYVAWNEGLDYSSYEHHGPSYNVYVAAMDAVPGQPVFSEDRFRIRNEGRSKDYTEEQTRRGLWHSLMAGGVANIWGNLIGARDANLGRIVSAPYPNPEWIKTNAEFVRQYFVADMVRCNGLTDGRCLRTQDHSLYLFYKEGTSTVELDVSGVSGARDAVAIDTRRAYAPINIGPLNASKQTWSAPRNSDWAIAVGVAASGGSPRPSAPPAPTEPTEPTQPPAPSSPSEPTEPPAPPAPTAPPAPPSDLVVN